VRSEIFAISVGIQVWSLHVEVTEAAAELAGLLDLHSNGCVVAVVDEIGTFCLRAVPEAYASAHSVEALAMPSVRATVCGNSADEARDRARYPHLLTNRCLVAMRCQVIAGRVLNEASLVVDIKARVFWCDILANGSAQLCSTHGNFEFVNNGVLNTCRLQVNGVSFDVLRILLRVMQWLSFTILGDLYRGVPPKRRCGY